MNPCLRWTLPAKDLGYGKFSAAFSRYCNWLSPTTEIPHVTPFTAQGNVVFYDGSTPLGAQ
jgi:hypothetical protein